ncbi:N-acetylneuraminate lyase [Secundilactobacillus collinoides]|uniref:N-acetylneuraminate lyase n=2 Tax=Secundilactobacillus collinoides TaxID=33960 RepID=A0A0R2B7G5_SECCO|nr:N-acetylneuraminate lyase [Secundilactobacillus collinoides]KRM75265.1 N-acetylneuraminate lyase [Secundilactobacillus collinoides DSM 20515 = JCM 1123]KZL35869.1 N-acetylneuraminate lyase [Secundilactobacillus collinoides]
MRKLYAALMTSFNKDNTINEQGTREMIRYNIDHNEVDGLYVGGSTGESFMQSTEERELVYKIAYEETAGKVDLIAQVGSVDVMEAKKLAKYAVDLGYKTISAVPPFYYHFSFEQIKNYYDMILEGLNTQLIIYSIPALSGVSLSLDQFTKLFDNPKIIGVKYTNNDFLLLQRLRAAFPDKVIYFGTDEMLISALPLGIDGAIGSTFNLNAKRAKAEMAAFDSGDIKKAFELQNVSNDFILDLIDNDLYPSIKLIFEELGVHAGYSKAPMSKPNPAMASGAKKIYETYFKN